MRCITRDGSFSWRQLKNAVLFCVLVFAGVAGAAAAQDQAPAGPGQAAQSATAEQAEVRLDGRTLFSVRGVTAFPAKVRAQAIGERIRAIAADPSIPVDSLRVVEATGRSDIFATERLIVSVHDFDAEMEGVPRHVLAEVHRKQIASAITAYRSERSKDALLAKTAHAAAATLALVVLFFAIRLARRWLEAMATRRMAGRIEGWKRGRDSSSGAASYGMRCTAHSRRCV